jgi:hypothetical protein
MSTGELWARRAAELGMRTEMLETMTERVTEHRLKWIRAWEEKHSKTIKDYNFQRGNLVLMRNSPADSGLSAKSRPRYLGPLVVISRNRGGAYILCEMDGAVLTRPVGAFRCIPYHARVSIPLPPIEEFLDIDTQYLREMEASHEKDLTFDGYTPIENAEDPEFAEETSDQE